MVVLNMSQKIVVSFFTQLLDWILTSWHGSLKSGSFHEVFNKIVCYLVYVKIFNKVVIQ